MNVKGNFFVSSKAIMVEVFGQERWNTFMARLVEKDNFFKNVIMSITLIPVEKLIVFFDEMCMEFFNNDKMQYQTFGRSGAKAALSPGGVYHSYLLSKDIKQFVEFALPKLWSTYYDGGSFKAWFDNNTVHIKITGIPVKYIYFEYLVMGYFQQALKVFGKKSVVKKVRSLSSGDDDLYFQFQLKDA
jgi:hypothetical protein